MTCVGPPSLHSLVCLSWPLLASLVVPALSNDNIDKNLLFRRDMNYVLRRLIRNPICTGIKRPTSRVSRRRDPLPQIKMTSIPGGNVVIL